MRLLQDIQVNWENLSSCVEIGPCWFVHKYSLRSMTVSISCGCNFLHAYYLPKYLVIY